MQKLRSPGLGNFEKHQILYIGGYPPFDLEPQTISEALVAARRTVEFQRTIPPYSQGLKKLKTLISQQILESEIFAGEKKLSKLRLQMVLGVREGMGKCVLDMGNTMGRISELEKAEKYEF